MNFHDDSFRWQFEQLLDAAREGDRERKEELREKILHQRQETFDPLTEFILEQPFEPWLAELLDLLGKMGDPRGARILVEFVSNPVEELRMQAAIGLGWLRARMGLEPLDEMEGTDESEAVRQEARVAIEEILRDHPQLRSMLKYHEPLALPENPLPPTSPMSFTPDRRLAGRFPRLLALKYHVVPLGFESADTLAFAIPEEADSAEMTKVLSELTGSAVELRAWPRKRIGDHMVSFYQWGDDDWVQFRGELTAEAWKLLSETILDSIRPEELHPALSDCADGLEAVQSFLALCAAEDVVGAEIEADPKKPSFEVLLKQRDGGERRLEPPAHRYRPRFLDILQALSGCEKKPSQRLPHCKGRLEHELEAGRTFLANVVYEEDGAVRRMGFEFVKPDSN